MWHVIVVAFKNQTVIDLYKKKNGCCTMYVLAIEQKLSFLPNIGNP